MAMFDGAASQAVGVQLGSADMVRAVLVDDVRDSHPELILSRGPEV
jgi:hypothetical protein